MADREGYYDRRHEAFWNWYNANPGAEAEREEEILDYSYIPKLPVQHLPPVALPPPGYAEGDVMPRQPSPGWDAYLQERAAQPDQIQRERDIRRQLDVPNWDNHTQDLRRSEGGGQPIRYEPLPPEPELIPVDYNPFTDLTPVSYDPFPEPVQAQVQTGERSYDSKRYQAYHEWEAQASPEELEAAPQGFRVWPTQPLSEDRLWMLRELPGYAEGQRMPRTPQAQSGWDMYLQERRAQPDQFQREWDIRRQLDVPNWDNHTQDLRRSEGGGQQISFEPGQAIQVDPYYQEQWRR